MTTPDSPQNVVVTDIRMPFWSMVTFMVKWALAAIPAILLLAIIGFGLSLLFTMMVTVKSEKDHPSVATPTPNFEIVPGSTKSVPFPSNVPDRCKGSTEIDKCIEMDRQMKLETPEQRSKRQAELDANR